MEPSSPSSWSVVLPTDLSSSRGSQVGSPDGHQRVGKELLVPFSLNPEGLTQRSSLGDPWEKHTDTDSSPQTHLDTQVCSGWSGSPTEPSSKLTGADAHVTPGRPKTAPGHMWVPDECVRTLKHTHTPSAGGIRCPQQHWHSPGRLPHADRANRPQCDLPHLCWHRGSFPWFQTQCHRPAPCPGPAEIPEGN